MTFKDRFSFGVADRTSTVSFGNLHDTGGLCQGTHPPLNLPAGSEKAIVAVGKILQEGISSTRFLGA